MTAVAFDLTPAADQLRTVALHVRDDQLALPTPCAEWTVRDLLAHTCGFVTAFRSTARHEDPGEAEARPGLADDWRDRLPDALVALSAAWQEESAWEGEATAGGVTMASAQLAVAALDELVLHTWDLARSSGQSIVPRSDDLTVIASMVEAVAAMGDNAPPGLFGRPQDVPSDGSELERLLALSGRDPAWTPTAG